MTAEVQVDTEDNRLTEDLSSVAATITIIPSVKFRVNNSEELTHLIEHFFYLTHGFWG